MAAASMTFVYVIFVPVTFVSDGSWPNIKLVKIDDQVFFFNSAVKYWEGKISFLKKQI